MIRLSPLIQYVKRMGVLDDPLFAFLPEHAYVVIPCLVVHKAKASVRRSPPCKAEISGEDLC